MFATDYNKYNKIYWKTREIRAHIRGIYISALIRFMGGQCGSSLRVGPGVIFKYLPHSGIRIGENVFLGKDTMIDVLPDGKLNIGNNVTFTTSIIIAAAQSIDIGNDVLVGEFTSIRDSDHGMNNKQLIRTQKILSESLIIGNDVWIGRGVAVLRGTSRIGESVIIGANAVVTSQIPDHAVAAGVPARILHYRKTDKTA